MGKLTKNLVSGVNVPVSIRRPLVGVDFSSAQIGDEIGGGVYAGVHVAGGASYHIVAAKSAGEALSLNWKFERSSTPGTSSVDDGFSNTEAIELAGLSDHEAANHCRGYAGGGHADWYLPAINELVLLYNNLATHPEFSDNVSSGELLWSSTEIDASNANVKRMSNGDEGGNKKDIAYNRVRPIRRVPV